MHVGVGDDADLRGMFEMAGVELVPHPKRPDRQVARDREHDEGERHVDGDEPVHTGFGDQMADARLQERDGEQDSRQPDEHRE